MMNRYIVVGCKPWNERIFDEVISKYPGEWNFVGNGYELNCGFGLVRPKYIFFLHWNWEVPKEIIEMLKAKRTTPGQRLKRQQAMIKGRKATKRNYILANRTGFIRESGRKLDFVLDALGLNIQPAGGGLRLLPCQALESAEREQSTEPDPIRFKMAGIVTEYKSNKYLLLQRATRTYSHGNFGN